MNEEKKYYQHIQELKPGEAVKKQVTQKDKDNQADILTLLDGSLTGPATRRNFLKLAGFSTVLATVLNSCEKPIHKAIPYLIKPEEITPGKSNYYASSFFDGEEFCSVLVKSRDGRPIKIEGNPLSSLTRGGTSARVQASVLSLYDNDRHHSPLKEGKEISWESADSEIKEKLTDIKARGGRIVLLTSTVISPSAGNIINDFLSAYPSAAHVTYDTVSSTGILQAHELTFGIKAIPAYRFDQTELIVSFGADFLGTWISPVEFTAKYAASRKLKDNRDTMTRHIHFETGMSITGTNADLRFPIKPSEEKTLLIELLNLINAKDQESITAISDPILKTGTELKQFRGKSLVISGSNDIETQVLVNQINHALGNYGKTLDITRPVFVRKGIDADMIKLVDDLSQGTIDALLMVNTNPVYHYPEADKFMAGLKKTPLTISLSAAADETSALSLYVCPDNHYLESWGDAEPAFNMYGLQQPLINPVFNTRQWEESLLRWSGSAVTMKEYLKGYWEKNLFPKQQEKKRFYDFWVTALQNGLFEPDFSPEVHPEMKEPVPVPGEKKQDGIEIQLFQSVAISTGRHANNPWLQELPDPVSKAVWENYAAISPRFATENGLEDFDVIEINKKISLPVLIQPGQAYGTISIALGYGRRNTGHVADGLGVNVYPLAKVGADTIGFSGTTGTFTKSGLKHTVARSQVFGDMEGRPIVREAPLQEYRKNPGAGNALHKEDQKKSVSLYAKPKYDGFHWGLSVDLNSCTGCSACIIACQAENNIPVVGKTEVSKFRIMHWIRIDRYYTGSPEQPDVVHQPVMCMHCDNAPCENVCPVSATPHNNEGLNQVAYTRCVGTKYCINNCPYKVRKFNWFQYAQNPKFNFHENSDLGRLVLNPDVTVRERGVVEKCSFCSQRIQEKKLQAKLDNRVLNGEEVQPACVQACPAKALVFGDLNNPENAVVHNAENERNYYLLEDLHTLPSVGYLTKIRNRNA
jgi:Fe-S-cluster-containing dehydrogenase component/anaerobic selenocysteine-containing dehydrogenase